MDKIAIAWIVGWVIATALIFVSSRRWSDDMAERLLGSLLLGTLSWVYVMIVVVVHLLRRGEGKEGGAR